MITASEFYKWLEVFQVLRGGVPPPSGALLAVNNLSDVNNLNTSVNNLYNNLDFTIIYVSNFGVNAPLRGNELNPYQTISYALSQITDNNTTKPYKIILHPGVYTETNLILKPCVFFNGNQSSLTVSGSVTLDAGWSAGGFLFFQFFNGLSFPATTTLDFTGSPTSFVYLSDNFQTSTSALNIIGDPTNGAIVILANNVDLGSSWDYTITNCYGALDGGDVGVVNINHTSETAGGNFNIIDVTHEGLLTVTDSTASGLTLFHTTSKVIAGATYVEASTGLFNVFARATQYLSAPTVDNGIGGGSVNFDSDILDSLPTLLNGAIYNPSSISDAMSANNYFTPSNYTPTNNGGSSPWSVNSVTGNFAGIDAKLSAIPPEPTLIAQQRWVSLVSGNDSNDGDIDSAFQTLVHAISQILGSVSFSENGVIHCIGSQSISGNLNFYPYVHIDGHDTAILNASGFFETNTIWQTTNNAVCYIKNIKFISTDGLSLVFNTANGNIIEFQDCDFTECKALSIATQGANTISNIVRFKNSSNNKTPSFSTSVFVVNTVLEMENMFIGCTPQITANGGLGSAGASVILTNCNLPGLLMDSTGSSGGNSVAYLKSTTVTNPIVYAGQYSLLNLDPASYTQEPAGSGGASSSQITVTALTDSLLQTSYSPANYSPYSPPGASYSVTTLTANLAGIDNALGALAPGIPIAQQLWVNLASGNDSNSGTLPNKSLATYDNGAYPIGLANASASNPYVIYIIGNASVSSNFNVLPYCTVIVLGGLLTIPGSMVLDSSYASANNAFSKIHGVIAAATGISLDYGAGDGNLITLEIDPTSTPSIACTTPNTTTDNGLLVSVLPNTEVFTGIFNSGVSFSNISVVLSNFYTYANVNLASLGSGNCYIALQNSELNNNLIADGTSGPVFFQLQNTFLAGLEIISTDSTGYIYDDQSYPEAITFSAGATISQISILGSPDGLQFSTTFTPVNFSLVGSATWPSNSVTAAFAGIDAQLATVGGGDLQDAYNAGTPGSQGLINLNTDNLNALITSNSVRGSGSTLQRHFDAFNSVVPPGTLGFWGNSYSGLNSSSAKVDYAYIAAFATTTTAGSETSTLTINMMQSGTPTTVLHINAAAKTIDTPYAIQNPAGSQTFNTKLPLTGNVTYSLGMLGFNNISDDASAYTITINTGGFALNLDDCFYVQTQGTNTVTIAPSGGATINGSTSSFTVPLYSKANVQLVNNSTMAWVVTFDSSLSAVSSGAFPFSWDSGNSSNLTTVGTATGSYIVCGDYITANLSVLVFPNANNATLAFIAPLVASGAFPVTNVVSMTANLSYYNASGGDTSYIGVATNQPMSLSGSNSIVVPFYTGGSSGFYMQLNMSFSYKFQNF